MSPLRLCGWTIVIISLPLGHLRVPAYSAVVLRVAPDPNPEGTMTSVAVNPTRHPMRRVVLAAAAGAAVLSAAPMVSAGMAPQAAASVASPAVQAMNVALAQQGDAYAYGATGPDAFDCSGLVQFAYGQVGIALPRTSGAQAGVGTPVNADQLQPSDLVFAYGGGHVGIYTGAGQYVYAPTEGDVVKVGPVPYGEVTALRRI